MYIPTWLIILAIIVFLIYRSKNKTKDVKTLQSPLSSVENIEDGIKPLKEDLFSLELHDSPHYIDCQNAFDVMEVNYFKLKQRFFHSPEKVLEIARDWYRYVEALGNIKYARVMLDVDWSDDIFDKTDERMKEPYIIKKEIEKKFKSLLGKGWEKIPADYFKRMETMKEPDEKAVKRYGIADDWKYYYQGSVNLFKLEEKRKKEKKEREAKK